MPSASTKIVTRFAPSPTGYLHVGGARTALFAWLLARHAGGRFLLRIEDTDLARSTPRATEQLLEDLRWLGLNWDNAELVLQSRRQDVYNAIIEDLITRGLAYKAYESREELAELRRIAEREKRQFIYRRREISPSELAQYERDRRPHVVRFAMPVKEYRFRDEVLGKEVVLPPEEVQDFVIRKEDGMPTYHFAVVVDDAEMGVTHILRGKEHLKNTFLHIALQEALGYPRPVYAHLPIIMNLDGSKMSKRDRDKKIRESTKVWMKNAGKSTNDLATATTLAPSRLEGWLKDSKSQLDLDEQQQIMRAIDLDESDLPEILVHDFRANGYFPEALLNFLALLGWNPGQDREQMRLDEMVQLFSMDRIGSNDPKFDRTKLLAFNTKYAEATAPEAQVKAFRDYLEIHADSPLNAATDAQLARLLEMKKGFRLLREVDQASRFLFIAEDAITYESSSVEKVLKKNDSEGARVLSDLRDLLAGTSEWNAAALESAVHQFGEQKQLGLGKLAQPLRVAISGTTISPPIFQSLEFLGRERTLARIDRCLGTIGSPT